MVSNKNIIEINGKKYDAFTGEAVDHLAKNNAHSASPKTISDIKVVRHPTTHVSSNKTHTSHHIVSKSHTLKRHLVHKPHTHTIRHPAADSDQPSHHFDTKPNTHTAEEIKHKTERLKRAALVNQSSKITHFGTPLETHVLTSHQVLDVIPAPEETVLPTHHASPHLTPPPIVAPRHVEREHRQHSSSAKSSTHHSKNPKKRTPLHHRISRKLSKRTYTTSIVTASIAALLFGSFFAYQRIPQVALQVAEQRAGIDGKMPLALSGYKNDGPIQYSNGQITFSFKSNSDDRAYYIAQRSSNWNSEALRTNFVASQSTNFESVLDRGRTIFLYGESNATWVDSGVWFEIDGNKNISQSQLLQIVASL